MTATKNMLRIIIDTLIQGSLLFVPKKRHTKKQILILRKDGLGDCLLFFPMLAHFREYYGDAEITLVFPKYFKSLSSLLSDMDTIIWFDHTKFGNSLWYRWMFFYNLKRSGYNVAIYPVYTREPIGDFMMKVTGAEEIIGFAREKGGPYTKKITIPDTLHGELDRNVYFTEQVTQRKIDAVRFPTIDTSKLPADSFEALVKEYELLEEDYVVVFPGSGATYKNWPPERFAEIVAYFVVRNITPVICGSQKELAIAEDISSFLSKDEMDATLVLSGKTDLPALAHLLKHAKLYFGSDTGILHLAVAVGTSTIALVGSGARGRFFPYGDERKNTILFDTTYPPTGEWNMEEVAQLAGEPHPSITGISVAAAQQEIEYVLSYT
jgi:heptosyltransferase-1